MNNLLVLDKTNFLTEVEADQLAKDIIEEQFVDCPQRSKKRQIICWYLRTYHYLPFSLISSIMEYKSVSSCTEAVFSIISANDSPLSLSHTYYDDITYFKSVSSKYYGCPDNKFLDRVQDESLQDALLLGAAKKCEYMDKVSRLGWFSYTPVNSPVLNLFHIWKALNNGVDSKEILEEYLIDEVRGLY
jgi:hypothetical protein